MPASPNTSRSSCCPLLLPVALLLTITALTACASTPLSTPQGAAVPCNGQEIAVVRNESGGTVDVFAVQGSTESFVGTARTGRSEFSLQAVEGQRHLIAREQDGERLLAGRASRSPTARVSLNVECRS